MLLPASHAHCIGAYYFPGLIKQLCLSVCLSVCLSYHRHGQAAHISGETEHRRHCGNEGPICAVAECRCRHDMMMIAILQ